MTGAARESDKQFHLHAGYHTGSRLAVKFAWRIGAGLLILFAILGLIIGLIVSSEVNKQINTSGARVVNALAAVDIEYWQAVSEQAGQDRPVLFLDRKPLTLKPNPLEEAIRLNNLPAQGIIKVVVLQGKITAMEGRNVEPLLQYDAVEGTGAELNFAEEHPHGDTGVFVADAFFSEAGSGGTGETYPVRQFRKPILDSRKNEVGSVILFLSAREIRETTREFIVWTAIVCLIALAVAVLFSLLLSAMVTRPARRLVRDMHVVAEGNLDHKAFGYGSDEIGALAQAFNGMTTGLKEAQRRELERKAIERELSIATDIQSSLLPVNVPEIPSLDIGAVYKSAREVGGDYYDYIPVDERHIGFVVADVSGKGIPGSMVMTMARSLIRYEAAGNPSPADTLRKTNRILARDIKKGMFVTAIYIIVDHAEGSIKLCCAGHNPILYWHAKSASVREVKPSGLALGVTAGAGFDGALKEVVINMEPGDRVVMYTDGVTEAMDKREKEFGVEQLGRLMSEYKEESADSFAEKVLEHVMAHSTGVEQHDDITLLNFIFRKPSNP